MELGKSTGYLKYSIIIFGTFILCNTGLVNSTDIKKFSRDEKKIENDIDNVFFEFTRKYEDYDSYTNQFDNFFGINYLEAENKRNFQDLSISNDSKEIRNLYEDILEDNTIIKKIKIDQEPFYKKKI